MKNASKVVGKCCSKQHRSWRAHEIAVTYESESTVALVSWKNRWTILKCYFSTIIKSYAYLHVVTLLQKKNRTMSKLSDVIHGCDLLYSTKITEQGKGVNELKRLIEDDRVRVSITECHKGKRKPNWNTICDAMSHYLKKECDSFAKNHQSWSDVSRNNKAKKLMDIFRFMKRILRIASSGNVKLDLASFLEYLIELLSEDVFVLNFGIPMLKIINDVMLGNRRISSEIPKSNICELLNICEVRMCREDEKMKFNVSSVLVSLTKIVVKNMDFVDNLQFHDIYMTCAKSLDDIKAYNIIGNVLTAANLYIKWSSLTHRELCCNFGEECLDYVLKMFRENISDSTLQHITSFCSLQITLHHPNMAVESSLGYYSKNHKVWCSKLYSIMIAADLLLHKQQSGIQHRFKESKKTGYDEGCVTLVGESACVIFKMVRKGSFIFPKTVTSCKSFVSYINFNDLTSILSHFKIGSNKTIEDIGKPWFAVLSFLLINHHELFNHGLLKSILEKFHHLLMNASFESLGPVGVSVIKNSLMLLTGRNCDHVGEDISVLSSIWKDCWNIAASSLVTSGRDTNICAIKFLETLIDSDKRIGKNFYVSTGVSKSAKSFWSTVYLQVSPSIDSISLASKLIQLYGIQCDKNAVFSTVLKTTPINMEFMECAGYMDLYKNNTLKLLILHWVLGFKHDNIIEKQANQTSGLTQSYKFPDKDDGKQITIITPKAFCRMTDMYNLVKAVSELLAAVIYKDSKGSDDFLTNPCDELDLKYVAETFLQHEFVSSFQYFNFEALPWLKDCRENSKEFVKLPQCDTTTEVIFGILFCSMNQIVENAKCYSSNNMSTQFFKLFQSFFLYANTAANLLYFRHKCNEFSSKCFESWLSLVVQFVKTAIIHLEKKNFIVVDDTLSEISASLSQFLEILSMQPFRQIGKITASINTRLLDPIYAIFKFILHQFHSEESKREPNEAESPDSHDDVLGLTQSMAASNSAAGRGYKRRKYNVEPEPPAKISKSSDTIDKSSSKANTGNDKSDLVWDHKFVRNIVRLAASIRSCFQFDDATRDILKIGLELSPANLSDLCCIYTIAEQICMVEGSLPSQYINDLLDIFQNVFGGWYKDQEISLKFLVLFARISRHILADRDVAYNDNVTNRIHDIVGIFWDLKSSNKCSYLTRMGISTCVLASIPVSSKPVTKDHFDKILNLLSDPHASVRGLTIFILAKIQGLCQYSVLQGYEEDFLAFITQMTSRASTKLTVDSAETLPLLSTSLHCTFLCFPCRSYEVEAEAHYLLCVIESLMQKFCSLSQCADLCSRCLTWISKQNFKSVFNFSHPEDSFVTAYNTRHLSKSLYRWITTRSGKLSDKVESFPYALYGYDDMKTLCCDFVKETFPAILCAVHDYQELASTYEAYFRDTLNGNSLNLLIKLCLAEIFQILLPNENLNPRLPVIFDDIYQRNNCYQYLLGECLGHVLVDIFMKANSNESLYSKLNLIGKLVQTGGSKLKSAQNADLSTILSELVFSKRKCTLIDMFTRIRLHFEKAWFDHEYKHCTDIYCKVISLLLQGSKMPETAMAYFINDVVSIITLNFTEIEDKMSVTTSQNDLKCGVESADTMIKLLTKVSKFLDSRPTKTTCGMNRLAILIVNLLLKCQQFDKKIGDFGLSSTEDFNTTCKNFANAVESLCECASFRRLYTFVDGSENPIIDDCTEALKECFATLDGLEIIKFDNPIVNKICESVVTNLRIESELVDLQTQKRLIDSVPMMLTILKTQTSKNLPLVDAVIEIYAHTSSLPVSMNFTHAIEDPEQLYISSIVAALIGAVNNKSSDISSTALACLKDFVKIPDVKGHLQVISQNDSLLNSVLSFLKSDTDRRLPVVPRSMECIKNSLKDVENMSDQNTLICTFTSSMIDFCQKAIFHSLKPICHKMKKMSALILPHVVHDILLRDPTQNAKHELSKFFGSCFKRVIENPHKQDQRMCIFLDVIQYLRTQDVSQIGAQFQKQAKPGVKSTSWDNNFWLDVDYMDLARVAICCNRPFMAVLFSEIWKETFESKSTLKKPATCRSLSRALNGFLDENSPSLVDNVRTPPSKDESMADILTQAYCKIEDLDSLYGLAGNSWNPALMMHIHSMESNWFKALEDYNLLMQISNSSSATNGIMQSLQWLGLAHIAEMYKKNSSLKTIDDQHIENACQMGKWDDVSSNKLFFSNLDKCQSYLQDWHPSLYPLIDSMWNDVVSSFEDNALSLNIFGRKTLDCIGKLTVIRDLLFAREVTTGGNSEEIPTERFIEKLGLSAVPFDSSLLSSYSCAESIILNRNKLVEIVTRGTKDLCNDSAAQNVIRANLALQIDLAIKSSREQMALQLIDSVMNGIAVSSVQFDKSTNVEYQRFLLKKAQVLWNADRKIHAISVSIDLRHILEDGEQLDEAHAGYHLAKVLQLSGTWLNQMKMESPTTIMENYFNQSVKIATKSTSNHGDSNSPLTKANFNKLHISGYKTLAEFADAQYREVVDYMTSKEFEHKRSLAREAKHEISKTSAKSIQGQNQKYLVLLQKNSRMDHRDFTNILERKEKFLLCAVENYIKCLSLSDVDDLLMYRICALWFENTQSASLPGLMQCACSELKTHKFVDVSYQLAARLDKKSQDKTFQATLTKLLKKLAIDHPHHVLPVLLALANAHRDAEFPKVRQKKTIPTTNDSTSEAANSIIHEVKKAKPKLELVTMMGYLSEAYIEFANYDVSRYSKTLSTPISFEKNLLLAKYCDTRIQDKYAGLVIPTIEIPVNKNGDYNAILQSASLSFFKGYFQLCGGINLPKIVVAVASDGSQRKHLVKGRDDLRQDAVMQHVFKVVNALLMQNEGPQNLRMCTYKVVPLSQRSGLVEWCEGTIPIGNYLIGVPSQRNFGAHHLYRPKDLISIECRKKLGATAKSHRQKLEIYRDICEKFQPVFRHFFYENFVAPDRWFQCRTAYCKSVSISSIVGYILGLGDRHVQNILINRSTGEVIHIDLGVAFEQGKCLPTPEMVPFRLTRDLVDAFGSSGVEGSFRRNCERCLRVLRSSIDVIATIVEVLLHDPLHDWMMTSNKAMQVQRDDTSIIESEMTASVLNASTVAELLQNEGPSTTTSSAQSSLAGRALLRVKEKLRGLESGSVLSVEGQVNMLIQQATDEEKLCAMFVGWQPYI